MALKSSELLGRPIPRSLAEHILLGPADDQRLLQDSPVLGDVWLAYSKQPAGVQDLLITPHTDVSSARTALAITKGIKFSRDKSQTSAAAANIAYLQGIVAARLGFGDVSRVVVPITLWWHDKDIPSKVNQKYLSSQLPTRLRFVFGMIESETANSTGKHTALDSIDRYVALTGLILWAARQSPLPVSTDNPDYALHFKSSIRTKTFVSEIIKLLEELFSSITKDRATGWASEFVPPVSKSKKSKPAFADKRIANMIFNVSLNRRALLAVEKSVPSVKADAAHSLFKVNCKPITWAVIDSGIFAGHGAFKGEDGKSRVTKSFDFTRVREIVSSDDLSDKSPEARAKRLSLNTSLKPAEAKEYLDQMAKDADQERPRNWALIEKFILLQDPGVPNSSHGTHVAGIIGANNRDFEGYGMGMCPDIQLYDFRILGKTDEETEFAVIAALQYIRYVNELHNCIMIHGANLSLGLPHDVRNFACGRTPLCNECERLVGSGVVVVAAAGNRGYQTFETREGPFASYAAFSITDPGNADGVITVGSTHRFWPHTYGVSYFSSRGPTGDGRLKPDLVAPGERIQSTVAGDGEWGYESGTSMAAPHVSGAAAMLMARYPELIGQPQRIKKILCDSATDLNRERSFQGHGMLDVLRAFQSI